MTPLTTKWHSLIDYLLAFMLICSPWLFYFKDKGAQTVVPLVCGGIIISYSFFTKYEISVLKRIGLKLHFAFDTIIGIFIAFSPWIFGFNEIVYFPHLAMGLTMVCLPLATNGNETRDHSKAPGRSHREYAQYHFSAWLGHKE
jgi:hypothetical protein